MDFRNAKDISIGGKSAIEIALDGRIVWQKTQPVAEGLCFTALEPNSTLRTVNDRIVSPEISYDGKTWLPHTEGWYITLSNVGDKVYMRSQSITHPASGNYTAFEMTGSIDISGNIFDLLKATNGEVYTGCFKNLFRSCTSLKSTSPDLFSEMTTAPEDCCRAMFVLCSGLETGPTSLPATELGPSCYRSMFQGTALKTAPELPATTLATYCYYYMFYQCTSLITAPELPATSLASYCYGYMFQGCSKLTTAPSELPADILTPYCYQYMFHSCTALTTAPELPATSLASYCYYYMFYGCTSLTTVPSILPATSLASHCYFYMFYGCTSLTTAPELPGTTLVDYCYQQMFYNCSKLNHIKVGATSWNANYAFNWVSGVSSTGTFYEKTGVSIQSGRHGIPSGWTVENY